MKLKFMKFLLLLWLLRFPTLLIHDEINAGNLIFPAIYEEPPRKVKLNEQSVGLFFAGGRRESAATGVNYLNPFMPRKLNLSLCGFTNLASCAY